MDNNSDVESLPITNSNPTVFSFDGNNSVSTAVHGNELEFEGSEPGGYKDF